MTPTVDMHAEHSDAAAALAQLQEKAHDAAQLLKMLGNEKRLLILCQLVAAGEMNVGRLADAVGLSQSALSQHLARMRSDGLVAYRRDAQTLYYRIDDPNTYRLLTALKDIFCPD